MTRAVRNILHPVELLTILLLTVAALDPNAIDSPPGTGPPAPPKACDSATAAAFNPPTAPANGIEADLAASIGYIEECRGIHLLWIRIMEADPERYANQTRYLGDVDYHREWVEKYDLVLKTLNGIKAQIEVNRQQLEPIPTCASAVFLSRWTNH